jgi:hypothetical protein
VSWHPRTIGETIADELGRFGRPGDLGAIVAAWPAAVGPAIAENAWPARLARDGTLTVATSSSVWAFELTKLEETLRDRLLAAVGEKAPPRLRFAPGRIPSPAAESTPEASRNAPNVTAADRRRAAELVGELDDEELRELVVRAAAASLARGAGSSRTAGSGPLPRLPDDRRL